MWFKSVPVIMISLIFLSAELWACGPAISYSWMDEADKPYFFSLALTELEAVTPAISAHDAAQTEMLQGWFYIIDGLANTEKNRADLLYILNEVSVEQLKIFKGALDKEIKDFQWIPALILNYLMSYNKAFESILRNKNMPALDYLIFMYELKKSGILARNRESWDYMAYSSKEFDSRDIFSHFIAQAKNGYKNQQNYELKWRYAFQLSRLYFYQQDYQSLIDFFVKEIDPQPNHPVKEWCRSFYGGALAAQDKLAAAIKEFALVSHRSAYYQASALSSLRLVIPRGQASDKIAAISMAKDDDEFAIMNEVLQFRNASDHSLSLLTTLSLIEEGGEIPLTLESDLAVAIGQLESDGYGELKEDFWGATKLPTRELERLILAIAPKRNYPAFWYLGAAHLATMRGEPDNAQQYIDLAIASNAERYFPKQLALTKLLKSAFLEPLDERGENIIGRQLHELDRLRLQSAEVEKGSVERRRYRTRTTPPITEAIQGVLELILGTRYQITGRNDRAFSCLAVSNNWMPGGKDNEFFHIKDSYLLYWPRAYVGLVLSDPYALKSINRTLLKPSGKLEEFFIKYSDGWTPTVLTELLGMAYIYRFEFKAAAQELISLDSQHKTWAEIRYQAKTPGNPFQYSPADIFGRRWQDDFKKFFEAAALILTEKELQSLVETVRPPKTFLEFAKQAETLASLTKFENELGLTAAYLYALTLYNIHKFPYWDQSCKRAGSEWGNCGSDDLGTLWALTYKSKPSPYTVKPVFGSYVMKGSALMPDPIADKIQPILMRVIRHTKNPELAARANFFLAALSQKEGGWRYVNYSNKKIQIDRPGEFLTYYRALHGYSDTEFVKTMSFKCPEAKFFLGVAKPISATQVSE